MEVALLVSLWFKGKKKKKQSCNTDYKEQNNISQNSKVAERGL